jgi:hypothetical protein
VGAILPPVKALFKRNPATQGRASQVRKSRHSSSPFKALTAAAPLDVQKGAASG